MTFLRPALAGSGRRRALRMRGFTLIEIMVVIVILGVLAALVVPRVLERPDEARVVAAKADIAAIVAALKLYRLDNQRYPTSEQGLAALIARPEAPPLPPNWKPGGYLEKLPKDPWGTPYQYLNPGLKGEIDVFSFGADRQPGGSGVDADIGSWDL
jgi:general secretion pathway protein G